MFFEHREKLTELKEEYRQLRGYFDLERMEKDHAELGSQMESSDFWNDPDRAAAINRKQKRLQEKIEKFKELEKELDDAEVLLDLAEEEEDQGEADEAARLIDLLSERVSKLKLEQLLSGEHDENNCFLSINAGAGGTEAQDWAQMLSRMYLRYCERVGFEVELFDEQPGEEAGLKSITFSVSGLYAYGYLKAEKGVHRLVRISPYDAAKRRHTSFAAVFVMPEIEEDINIEVNSDDIRVDTYRASGHGGQKVNKTSSAVRITHYPSGIVVQCQNERSQHKNKAQAMKVLKAKLYELEQTRQKQKMEGFAADKKDIEWGSQIRSYVLQPYQLVKDLRTGHETGNIQAVLDGDIQNFIESYLLHQARPSEGQEKEEPMEESAS
ncbi:MAG: peptide chain release factor 2 [bacterium]